MADEMLSRVMEAIDQQRDSFISQQSRQQLDAFFSFGNKFGSSNEQPDPREKNLIERQTEAISDFQRQDLESLATPAPHSYRENLAEEEEETEYNAHGRNQFRPVAKLPRPEYLRETGSARDYMDRGKIYFGSAELSNNLDNTNRKIIKTKKSEKKEKLYNLIRKYKSRAKSKMMSEDLSPPEAEKNDAGETDLKSSWNWDAGFEEFPAYLDKTQYSHIARQCITYLFLHQLQQPITNPLQYCQCFYMCINLP